MNAGEGVLKFLSLGFFVVLAGLFLKNAGEINQLFGTYNSVLKTLEGASG
jgi:hypothetical protein